MLGSDGGTEMVLCFLHRSWSCTKVLLYGECWISNCNIPAFILYFFSSSMLLFIHLCNWDNLWDPAAWLLVWWCWNANAIAKLTVVSFPGFSIPSASWFSGNIVQSLLFPCLACCARFSPHQTCCSPFVPPFWVGFSLSVSPVVTHSHSALCAHQFVLSECCSCSDAEKRL